MIDIHCHILPGVDDGARDIPESLAMIHAAVDSGVTGIVATPHFRGEQRSLNYVPMLLDRFRRLEYAAREAGLPVKLYPGAEILCMPQTVEMARRRELPTLGETDYLLCEFYFDEHISYMDEMLTELHKAGYVPVVAHPERYHAIQHDPRSLERWFSKGYLIQLNKGSLLGAFGYEEQRMAEWVLGNGLGHIIASDAHGANRRTTDMGAVRKWLLEKYPPAYGKVLLDINPARLVRGEEMYRP